MVRAFFSSFIFFLKKKIVTILLHFYQDLYEESVIVFKSCLGSFLNIRKAYFKVK